MSTASSSVDSIKQLFRPEVAPIIAALSKQYASESSTSTTETAFTRHLLAGSTPPATETPAALVKETAVLKSLIHSQAGPFHEPRHLDEAHWLRQWSAGVSPYHASGRHRKPHPAPARRRDKSAAITRLHPKLESTLWSLDHLGARLGLLRCYVC